MSSFPPVADALTQPYWEGCKRHELHVQRCLDCGVRRHRPSAGCYRCGSQQVEWVELSGRGRIYTYTVVYRAFHPGFSDNVPYIVAVVEAEEDASVRFLSRLVECAPADVSIGMPVDVIFAALEDDSVLPYWRPASKA